MTGSQDFVADATGAVVQDGTSQDAALAPRSHLADVLRASSLFGALDDAVLRALEAELVPVSLTSGAVLFRQGDPGDSLYIVIGGRLHVFFSPDAQTRRIIERPGPGEIVGEMALLNDRPRSATVAAARDTQLAMLTKEGLSRLTAQHPQAIFSAFVRQLSARLNDKIAGAKTANACPTCIAVMSPLPGPHMDLFCGRLAEHLGRFGPILHLSSRRIDQIFDGTAIAQSEPEDGGHLRLANWLTAQETAYAQILYQADDCPSPWTARCLRQADLLLLVVRQAGDIDADVAALAALTRDFAAADQRKILILLHDDAEAEPRGTTLWTKRLVADRHFHVRLPLDGDFARLSRFLTGRSVGLALGGGFARGIGHVGVIRAMRELGIPIDMVGGTSMGAIIAGQCSVEWDVAAMTETSAQRAAAALKGDYTLPFVSFLTGRKFSETITFIAAGRDIEDTLIPFFCVSASLTRCDMKIHAAGDAAKSIIASARAPGMFPPLSWNDELLVDGGLVNMVPAGVMREFLGGGTVIAVDVSPRLDFEKVDFGLYYSGWRALWQQLNPFCRAERTVGIIDVLMRILEFGRAPYASPGDHADAHLVLPLGRYSHRDFNRGAAMAEVSYQYAMTFFKHWLDEFGTPWHNTDQ